MEVFLASHEPILALLYMLGIAVWMGLWYVADGYRLMMRPIRLLWLPPVPISQLLRGFAEGGYEPSVHLVKLPAHRLARRMEHRRR